MIAPPVAPQWVLHHRRDPARATALAAALGAPLAIAHALVHRGIDTPEAARRYLEPSLDDVGDPGTMRDLDRAVARIRRAIAEGTGILVHGDYDVDGVTSTFLLVSVLRELGGRVEFRIPHRTRDGYGLTREAMDDAHRRGCGLVVTVDCGITAVEAVAHGRSLGIDTVITDHHEPPARLPDAEAIVNPHREGCGYAFKALAGVGVTFKLVQALFAPDRERPRAWLDVVALGTIADVVPLVHENRILARLGLDQLNRDPRIGMRALIDVAGLTGRPITSGQVAFGLAPRINAAGRMGNAEQGLRLLLARDAGEARDLAQSLEDDNLLRRRFDEEALAEAIQRVETELAWPACHSILLWSERWHPGVIGIVASRLVERFQRPTVLVALDGDRGRGSGRSVAGFDLHAALTACTDLLVAHGGHAFAAGLTVQRDRLPELRERLEAYVRERLNPDDCQPRLTLDAELSIGGCALEVVDWLDRMAPHGLDNPEPAFLATDVTVVSVASVGQGRHLKLAVRDATGSADAIGFGLGPRAKELSRGARCDLAFVPSRNAWMGETRLQLKVKGFRVT